MTFAENCHQHKRELNRFSDALLEVDTDSPFDWTDEWTDEYDNSIEFGDVPVGFVLSEKRQKFLIDAGFSRCWLNHTDKSETVYCWHGSSKEIRLPKFKNSESS